jgi:PAS domain S-box-containing protein
MEVKTKPSRLNSIIANLKLKELEIVEKLSSNLPHNSKMLRTIVSPNQHNFIAVNGDWEEILGYNEDDCRGKKINFILPQYEFERTNNFIDKLKDVKNGFSIYKCDIQTKSGEMLKVIWKLKYYSDLNIIVSVGRLSL